MSVEMEDEMEKYRYWSKSNSRFIRIFAVVGDLQVMLFYEDLNDFKTIARIEWNLLINQGSIIPGWE